MNPALEILPWEYNIDFRPQNVEMKRYFIQQLPEDATPLLTWENGKSFEIDGLQGYLRDYSLNQVGPAEVTDAQIAAARGRNMKIYSKADTFASWQYGTIPYLPFPFQWYERYKALEKYGVNGTLESWSSGYTPNFMTHLRAWTCWSDAPPFEDLLKQTAAHLFGSANTELALTAWDHFSRAIRLVLDTGPNFGTNNAVGNPIFLQEPPLRTMTFTHSWTDHDKWTGYLGAQINPYWPFTVTRMVFYPDFTNKANMAEIYARGATGVETGSETKLLPLFLKYLGLANEQMEQGLHLYREAALRSRSPNERVPSGSGDRRTDSANDPERFGYPRIRRPAATIRGRTRPRKTFRNAGQDGTDSPRGIERTELALIAARRDSRLGFQFEQDYVHTPYSLRENWKACTKPWNSKYPRDEQQSLNGRQMNFNSWED